MVLAKKKLPRCFTKESVILSDMAFYTKVGGVAMGSPLGPSLANAFLCHHQTK